MGTVAKPGFYGGRFHQGGQSTAAADAPDLDKLPKDALVALALERGVSHDPAATKAQIVEAIRAAEAR